MKIAGAVLLLVVLAGCAAQSQPTATPTPVTATATPSPSAEARGPVQPAGDPTVIVTGLSAPWSMVRLDSGSTLISERDAGVVKELQANGTLRDVATIPGVVHAGEGGLLGLEYVEHDGAWLYAYFTSESDNRIQRFPLLGGPGSYSLGAAQDILTGLAKANNHDGGRIKLGPDGMLYATVGDATNTDNAQNVDSLNGKILRMNLDGSVPKDNPFPGSLVYSYGHRNPQGLAWDADGQLWAAEFGQDTWDEFNVIHAGANYGWPIVEGIADDPRFVNPVYQWPTDDASPSGLARIGSTFFMAGLGGERLWVIQGAVAQPGSAATATAFYANTYGRIRDVVPGPDGTLWVLTNNTDGRGDPRDGDDRILQVSLTVAG
ncbi:MAG: PQQ-dependent sugar dehydrogenase [Rhodoglobus sp.]|nr:PQQ-dependent sugar dehydrogenase [Rhodoglobus sp.]